VGAIGEARRDTAPLAQRIGADDFMKKPFSRFEVFARVEKLLDGEAAPKRGA
jgi:DNA-binding response OmpR family regulator